MLKYNLSIFKGQFVSFEYYVNISEGETPKLVRRNFLSPVKKMKMSKNGIVKVDFENGNRCEISPQLFNKYCLTKDYQNRVYYNFSIKENVVNPLVGFTMYDTYGFPPELTNEILHNKLDMNGVKLCLELQKKMSEGTFKLKDNTWE